MTKAMTEVEKNHILQTAAYIKQASVTESSGHDWWHIYRVWNNAKQIAKSEPRANHYIVEIASLLHDIADWKLHKGDEEIGPQQARVWLKKIGSKEEDIQAVAQIIKEISFKGVGVKASFSSLESKIVHDADKLDAIGAIGIARTFAYGGNQNRIIYNPEIKPTVHTSSKQYLDDHSHTINHFYEKLLLLKNRMQTTSGKRLAINRHKFMQQYLKQFYKEWDGKS